MKNYLLKFIILKVLFLVIALNTTVNGQNMVNSKRNNTCLNGWWDFQPVLTQEGKKHCKPGTIPAQNWLTKGMIVPGSWKSKTGGRIIESTKVWLNWRMSDSYGFPPQWDTTRTAWYRRTFHVGKISKEKSYFLRFDGVLRESWIYVNGKEVGHRKEGSLPSDHDISSAIVSGNNEIAVFVTDYKRDEKGMAFVQVGADQMDAHAGIWGDVFFEERPMVRVEDLTIQTSTRKNELTVIYTLINQSKKEVSVTPDFNVSENGKTHLSFTDNTISLKPGETRTITKVTSWKGYIPWTTTNPQLYYLAVSLNAKSGVLDYYSERFGFREVWIDGHDIILNGKPIHLLGEWGHKDHFDFFRPEYVRQWFGMLKDMNMNYIRTHTFPHPKFMMDIADEMGILVCLESSWFMSNRNAMDKDEYWVNAREHASDIVKYYKNHPSIIFWSSGNEVRWSREYLSEVIKHGPEIDKVYEEADPTRVVFSDGSTSLWDERKQKIISRHYGLECTGEEFWDKTKPLHVGEFGKWHYGQPIDNLVWGNDSIFGSFQACATAIADEAADIILQARSNEVACMFPWNISCLDNYRPSPKETIHTWADFTTPYAKPLRTGAYATEFAWWDVNSKGYIPGAGFNIIKQANRPFAIYIREKLNQVFSDNEIYHTVSLINDLGKDLKGNLKVEAWLSNKLVYSKSFNKFINSGKTNREVIKIPAIALNQKSELTIKTIFQSGSTKYDDVTRKIWITPASEKTEKWSVGNCLVFGDGNLKKTLGDHGVNFKYIKQLDTILQAREQLLIIEKNSIAAGSTQNKTIQTFIDKGGKVFLMEQDNSVMPQINIESKPSEATFIRAYNHPLMNHFSQDEFNYWGNAPYGKSNSDAWVVIKPFKKPNFGNSTILLDCGFGDFGSGGLLWTPLFETRSGNGIAIASQLRLTEKIDLHPSAHKMMKQILLYLSGWNVKPETRLAVIDPQDQKDVEKIGTKTYSNDQAGILLVSGKSLSNNDLSTELKKRANDGATIIIHDLDSIALVSLAKQWNIDLQPVKLGAQYNLVRDKGDGLINGISNEETFWLDKGHYTPANNINIKMTDWLMASKTGVSLLSSESQSCWREFDTEGAMSEWTRMPVITHYLYNGPRKSASGMMMFPVGKGKLILCQIPLPSSGYFKSKIFWSQIFANLGVAFSTSLFEGEKVTGGAVKSKGYPENIRLVKNPDAKLLDEILSKGDPGESSERFRNQGLTDGFKWEKIKTNNGELTLPEASNELIIYYEMNPGRPRKLTEVVGGWPDPSQQTLIDLYGKGEVTLYVNGKRYQPVALDGGKATIADIDLNQFWNSILIHFKPITDKTLKMQWRNRQSRPEVEFQF